MYLTVHQKGMQKRETNLMWCWGGSNSACEAGRNKQSALFGLLANRDICIVKGQKQRKELSRNGRKQCIGTKERI